MRSGLLDPRVVVELRADDESGHTFLSVIDQGQPAEATIRAERRDGVDEWASAINVPLPDRLVTLSIAMPKAPARGSIVLWTHRSGLDGVPRPLPVNATLRMGDDFIRLEPASGSDRALAALEGGQPWVLHVSLGRRQATQSTTGASR